MDNNTHILRVELMRRIRADAPNIANDAAAALAEQIEATGAYVHDGETVRPIGDESQMRQASKLAERVCGRIARDFVAHSASRSSPEAAPYDRARARMQAMGFDLERALSGEHDLVVREFCGVDLSSIEPKGAAK